MKSIQDNKMEFKWNKISEEKPKCHKIWIKSSGNDTECLEESLANRLGQVVGDLKIR